MTFGRRLAQTLAAFGLMAAAAILLAPLVGSTSISLRRAFDMSIPFADNVDAQIFFVARLPRTLAGAFVGATARLGGRRLPGSAAQPAGHAVHAWRLRRRRARRDARDHVQLVAGVDRDLSGSAGGVRGSLAAVGVVYALARARQHGLSTNVLLLAGVTMNAFFSAMILFVQYFANFADTYRTLRWLMGDLDVSSYHRCSPRCRSRDCVRRVRLAGAAAEPPVAGRRQRGIARPRRRESQRAAFFSASLATGAAVSVGGPIGFVGIIVPHLVRLLVGPDHRLVLPASALFGAAFLVGCDVLSRTVMAPVELPVGVITALIGGPFFLWLLVRKR